MEISNKTSLLAPRPKSSSPHRSSGPYLPVDPALSLTSGCRGLIGPQRLFSNGTLYHPQVYAALIGAIIPVPLWFWVRKYPRSVFRNMNLPVIFNGALSIPPATGVNYSSWLVTGFIFQFWIRRRRFAWWSKVGPYSLRPRAQKRVGADRGQQYNYVLSAALDVGTALSAVVIFLVLDLPGAQVNWWGNTVYKNSQSTMVSSGLMKLPR